MDVSQGLGLDEGVEERVDEAMKQVDVEAASR